MYEGRVVSLCFEIRDLVDALDGARILAEGVRNGQLASDGDIRQAEASVISFLTMTAARLRLVAAVLEEQMPPKWLWTPSNDTGPDNGNRGVLLECDDGRGAGSPRRTPARRTRR